MAEAGVTKPIRLPGILERYYIARNSLGFYNNVGATAFYTIPSALCPPALRTGDSTSNIEALTYRVLAKIIPQHPSLGISVVDANTQTPAWRHLETVDLAQIVTFAENAQIEGQIASLHSTPLHGANGTLPLWHVLINYSAPDIPTDDPLASTTAFQLTVGFFFNHALGDGFSGAAFHHSFLSALTTILSSSSLDSPQTTIINPPKTDLLPDFETAILLPISVGTLLKVGYRTLFPARGIWTGPPITFSHSQPIVTKLSVLNLSASRVADLVALCRRNETSMTALLTVVLAEVLAGKVGDAEVVNGLVASIAISLRKFAEGVGKSDMVAYTSGFNYTFIRSNATGKGRLGVSEKSIKDEDGVVDWDEVRRVKKELAKAAGSNRDQYSAFLRLIPDMFGFLKGKVGKARAESFEVSNLGVVDFSGDKMTGEKIYGEKISGGADDGNSEGTERVKCERLIFSQAANVTGALWDFSIATVKGGEMSVALTWQKGLLRDALVESVMKDLDRWLTPERLSSGDNKVM